MYYFGCLNGPGHYLFDASLKKLHRTPDDFPIANYEMLDGGFFPNWLSVDSREGIVVPWACPDWAIFSFRDRSIDRRHGSCSVFVLRMDGDDKPEKTLLRACLAFPTIVQRFTFPLIMDGKQVWPLKVPESALLPCPFCGGEAAESAFGKPAYDVGNSWVPGVAEAVVRCKDCGASITCNRSLGSADGTDKDALDVLARARHSWNRRSK